MIGNDEAVTRNRFLILCRDLGGNCRKKRKTQVVFITSFILSLTSLQGKDLRTRSDYSTCFTKQTHENRLRMFFSLRLTSTVEPLFLGTGFLSARPKGGWDPLHWDGGRSLLPQTVSSTSAMAAAANEDRINIYERAIRKLRKLTVTVVGRWKHPGTAWTAFISSSPNDHSK